MNCLPANFERCHFLSQRAQKWKEKPSEQKAELALLTLDKELANISLPKKPFNSVLGFGDLSYFEDWDIKQKF